MRYRDLNSRQRSIVNNFLFVTAATIVAILVIIVFREYVNRTEATRAVEHLGKVVLKYREEKGFIPPESYILGVKDELEGYARIGNLHYRALWIDSECGDDEILAYTQTGGNAMFLGSGFVVLRLDGRVEWMKEKDFKEMFAQQQDPLEVQMLSQKHKQ